MEENADKRLRKDRRAQPTPAISRYTLFGRRKDFRRKAELQKGGYVDRYSSTLFFFLIMILSLNILDAFFTLIILDLKGWEANPVVRSVIDLYGMKFWIWKFFIVSFSLTLLCLHSRFKLVKEAIIGISFVYFAVVIYQIVLLVHL